MNTTEARRIAAEWHSGQASPLYSFSSTGVCHFPADEYAIEVATAIREAEAQDPPGYAPAIQELRDLAAYLSEHAPATA